MKRWIALLICITMCCTSIGNITLQTISAEVNEGQSIKTDNLIDMDALYGWATVRAYGVDTVTGGGMAEPIIVTTAKELNQYISDDVPRVIVIDGTINLLGYTYPGCNKTIVGIDKDATVIGDFIISGKNNIIISNLNIKGAWPVTRPEDGIEVSNSHHIWLDHLNIWDAPDGNLDIKGGSDYITVSWCKFWYTNEAHEHRLSNLISSGTGNDITDMDKLHVTYHHNWFADLIMERQPRILYGMGHVYNNYYTSTGCTYCVGVGCYGSALIENNYFNKVNNPHQFFYSDAYPASIVARGNVYDNTTGAKDTGMVEGSGTININPFDATPYSYILDDADEIPDIVTKYAGPQDVLGDEGYVSEGIFVKAGEQSELIPNPIETKAPYIYDNPVTYDKETDTYTYHGQNSNGSNGGFDIINPFAGMDLSETPVYSESKTPIWSKGVTLSYWVYIPDGVWDTPVFNFNLLNNRQISADDAILYEICSNYDPELTRYKMGTVSTYYSLSGKPLTVLKGAGKYAYCNPDYPEEGCYSISGAGTIPAYPEGADPEDSSQYVYLKYLGEGVYDKYRAKFDEENGEKSEIEEVLVNGSLSLYASGTVGYCRDNETGQSINPNLDSYGNVTNVDAGNEFSYWANGSRWGMSNGISTPTVQQKNQWHFVVTVIQNDWIQTYMDGIKITTDYLSYFGSDLINSDEYFDYINAKSYSFNYGYGPRVRYRTITPDSKYKYTRTMLDMITDETTILTIGGTGCSASIFSQDNTWSNGTNSGVQVKNVKAYPIAVAEDCIGEDYVLSYVGGYGLQGEEIVTLTSDATPIPTETPTPEPTEMPTQEPTVTPEPFKLGDVDMNGSIDAVDALLILKQAAKITELTNVQKGLADIEEDDNINAADALKVLKIAAKIIFD